MQILGQELPEDKLVDHALAGISSNNLAIDGLKQEAATKAEICVANLA